MLFATLKLVYTVLDHCRFGLELGTGYAASSGIILYHILGSFVYTKSC